MDRVKNVPQLDITELGDRIAWLIKIPGIAWPIRGELVLPDVSNERRAVILELVRRSWTEAARTWALG